jgi:uridine phosphorylase
MNVIVLDVLTQDQPQLQLAGDQHPVKALAPGAGNPPLAEYGPDQALRIAERFGDATMAGSTGLFQTATAQCDGYRVSVVTTGSGAPELELVLNELMTHTAARTYLYFGVAAGLHPQVAPGDLVVASGVIRGDGMTRAYVETSYPAGCSYEVVTAMVSAAAQAQARFHVGVVRSTDSDSLGIGRPSVGGYMQPCHAEVLDYWIRAGALSNDRESSAVVTLASLFGRRAGAMLAVTDNYTLGEAIQPGSGVSSALGVLAGAVRELAAMDRATADRGERYWRPE